VVVGVVGAGVGQAGEEGVHPGVCLRLLVERGEGGVGGGGQRRDSAAPEGGAARLEEAQRGVQPGGSSFWKITNKGFFKKGYCLC